MKTATRAGPRSARPVPAAVFCAAVIPDAKAGYKGGGSCFIARSSWSMTRDIPGHLLNATPYSGWSRGIYYNRQEDVLTKREQAVVIADIDPVYMNEGKPRPQALPLPMQLVAHLPIVEMVDPSRLAESYMVKNGGFAPIKMPSVEKLTKAISAQHINEVAATFEDVSSYLKKVRTTNLIDAKAQLANGKELANEAARMKSFFAEPSGWSARLECWSRNWREMPFYGCPPTLVDWLPVDLSPTNGELPKIFVPPWGADYGGPASLADEN